MPRGTVCRTNAGEPLNPPMDLASTKYARARDGYSLDQKRSFIDGKGDIPDIVRKFKERRVESTNSILVPLETINKNGYNLSFRRYKPVEYEKVEYEDPEVLINKILQLEEEIAENLQELKAMTNEEG